MISPLIIPLLLTRQADADRAERRIKQAQYCEAVEARAQHREIERVQPQSHLEPEYDRANRQVRGGPVDCAGADQKNGGNVTK
jgi:hypothetical protein